MSRSSAGLRGWKHKEHKRKYLVQLKKAKNFTWWKRQTTKATHKDTKVRPNNYADAMAQHIRPHRCQTFGKACTKYGHSNHFKRVCRNPSRPAPKEIGRDRHIAIYEMWVDSDDSEVWAREFNVIKSKVSNFHSMRLVITWRCGCQMDSHGTLNMQVMGLNLSAASWLTM